MNEYIIDLTELVQPPKTDSISGREFGEQHALDTKLLDYLDAGDTIIIRIDSNLVKAINDSFIKGFFSKVFEKYPSLKDVKSKIKLECDDNFKRLFEKNWLILSAIANV